MARCIQQNGDPYDSIKVICTQFGEGTQSTPVAECNLHVRCLPTFRPNGELYNKWVQEFKPESEMYKVCKYCPDFSL